jgi:nucleotide-binding universal stress UspA family protein
LRGDVAQHLREQAGSPPQDLRASLAGFRPSAVARGLDVHFMRRSSMKSILVAIDGSPEASKALETASQLARQLGAALKIVYVVPPIEPAFELAQFQSFQMAHEEYGVGLLASCEKRSELPAGRVSTALLRGRVAETLSDLADREQADLVVVGSRGLGAIGRTLLGSVSDRLAHICKRPVMIAR